ncbi:MAG: DUF5690 family protein, partial [Candidatus Poribacteria bacterium]|nr:DUF5690 family protein [Candidatus Poribacteria bacterium]
MNQRITRWMQGLGVVPFSLVAVSIAFTTYFCMYAFRKPRTAGTFEGELDWFGGFGLKTALMLGQTIGYATSKFMGIKFVTEMPRGQRAIALVLLIGLAELALLAFGILPGPWKIAAIFVNGLPLGMIWGIVFSFMEG